ncbi:MAG: PBSX family phage terminase large subunit [Thermoplasmatales archaeon]|nr:MAG: PBSX family phage terminase large subunit [Thermoplasmatales archaeon]
MIKEIQFPSKIIPFVTSDKRYNVLRGGRGSSKSWSISDIFIIKALREKCILLCTREIQKTIKDSVHTLLSNSIERLEVSDKFKINKDGIYCTNGSRFIFKGLRHDIEEIKSTEGVMYCWVSEAETMSQDSLDVLIPTIRTEGSQIWVDYNPKRDNAPVDVAFYQTKRDDCLIETINYYDNPFFPEVLRKEMEWDKQNNYDKYRHVWLGEYKNISDACVFKDKFVVGHFETHSDVEFYYGADWGFSNDPATLVRCYEYDDNLYIDYEAYGVGIELDEYEQFYDQIPGARDHLIIADNSRPDTISFLKRKGFNIKGSDKGKGSIEDGIEFIKKFKKVIIHPRCKNTIYEFENYSYKKDRLTGEILNIILDKDNHCFVGDTKIKTKEGDKRLDEITVKDYVLTRKGYKKVLKVFKNGKSKVKKYKFANSKSLTGTDMHNIISEKGKVLLNNISKDDILYLWSDSLCRLLKAKNTRKSYIKAYAIEGIQKAKEVLTENTLKELLVLTVKRLAKVYMSLFGKRSTAKSRKDFTSIIRTATITIIRLIICMLLIADITYLYTQKNIMKKTRRKLRQILTKLGILQKSGILAKKAKNGIANTIKILWEKSNIRNINVCNVAKSISQRANKQSFVQTIVSQNIEGLMGSTMFQKLVCFAEKNSFQTNIKTLNIVLDHAQTEVEVYDLMIDECHEYIANGVLVSNSIDAIRYSLERLRKGMDKVRASKVSASSLGL